MAIKKGSFTFEFMYDTADSPDEVVQAMSISEIFEECDSGAMIGALAESGLTIEDVPEDEVKPTLIRFGNADASFFDFHDSLAGDEE